MGSGRSPNSWRSASPRARANTAPDESWRRRSNSGETSPLYVRQRAGSSPARRDNPTLVRGEKFGVRLTPGSVFYLPEGIEQLQLVGLWSTPSLRPTARFERARSDGTLVPLDAELLPHNAMGTPLETTRGTLKWTEYTHSMHDERALPARLMRKAPAGCPWEWLPARELKSTYGQSSTANVAIDLSRVPKTVRFLSFTLIARRGVIGSARAPQIQVLEGNDAGGQVLCTHVASNIGSAERSSTEIVMCRLWQLPDDVDAESREGEVWPSMRETTLVERTEGSGYSSGSSAIRQVIGHGRNRIGQRNVAVIDTNRAGSPHRGARRVGGGWEKVESPVQWALEILESGDPDRNHLTLSPVVPQSDSSDNTDMHSVSDTFDIDRSALSAGSWSGRHEQTERMASVERLRLEREAARRKPVRSRSPPRSRSPQRRWENEESNSCGPLLVAGVVVLFVLLLLVALAATTHHVPQWYDNGQIRQASQSGQPEVPSPLAPPAPEARPPLPSTHSEQPASFNASAVWAQTADEIAGLVQILELDLPECFDQHPDIVAVMLIVYACGFVLSCCGCLRWCKHHREHTKLYHRLPSWLPRLGSQRMSPREIQDEMRFNQADTRRRCYLVCSLSCIAVVSLSTLGLYLWYHFGGCVTQPEYDECGLPLSVPNEEAQQQQQQEASNLTNSAPAVIDAFCCPQLDVVTSDGSLVTVTRPCAFNPQMPDECSEIMAYASGTVEAPPYPAWQAIAKSGRGQQLCTGTQTVGFDRCRYSFQARVAASIDVAPAIDDPVEDEPPPASRCGFCAGNTPATKQADIVCDHRHSVLVEGANLTRGRDTATCCVTTGMCAGNSRPDEEPDVICPAPQALRPPTPHHAGWRPGRSVEECCWVRHMCAGNTDGELDITCAAPSVMRADAHLIDARDDESCCVTYCSTVACPFPSELRPDAASIVGADASACCIVTGMCAGNSDKIAEPDVDCSAPSVQRPGPPAHRVGRDERQCCEVTGMCAGNSDSTREPDIFCEVGVQQPIRSVRTPWSAAWRDMVSSNGSFARGRSQRQCCECVENPRSDETQPMLEGYCFAVGSATTTIAVALSADNACTRVMRYAKCLSLTKCREDGEEGEQARRSDECVACAEVRITSSPTHFTVLRAHTQGHGRAAGLTTSLLTLLMLVCVPVQQQAPYPSWRELSAASVAQGACMDTHTGSPSRDMCIYSFQQLSPLSETRTQVDCGLVDSAVVTTTEQMQSDVDPSASWSEQG